MLTSLGFPHISRGKSCKLYVFRYKWELCVALSGVPLFLRVWEVSTGEINFSRIREALLGHLARPHVPKGCEKRDKILTDRIVRMDAYPAAYGGFSDVWRCQMLFKQKPPRRVAVKVVRPMVANYKELQVKQKAVKRELDLWARLDHPNVLPLYGITFEFGPVPAFVCPWADNGTLSEYLENSGPRLDLKQRMTLLGDIATGLQYRASLALLDIQPIPSTDVVHSRNIVHGDLSGSNILIAERGRALLSDFGLSTIVEASDTSVPGVSFPGNIRWAAPELFDECEEGAPASQLSSPQADIYSFGSIMLQILTGKLPFHGVQRVAQIVIMISQGNRPPRENAWDGKPIPDMLWKFVEKCWTSPTKRPSSEQIVHFIGSQLSRM